jgi:hypothetical protein
MPIRLQPIEEPGKSTVSRRNKNRLLDVLRSKAREVVIIPLKGEHSTCAYANTEKYRSEFGEHGFLPFVEMCTANILQGCGMRNY